MAEGSEAGARAGTTSIDSASMVRDLLRSRIEESNRLQGQLNDAVARLAELSFVLEEKEFELKTVRMSLDAEQKRSGMYEEELRKMQQLYQQVLASASHRLPSTSMPASTPAPARAVEASPKSSPSSSGTSREMKVRALTSESEASGSPRGGSDTEQEAEEVVATADVKDEEQTAAKAEEEAETERPRQMTVPTSPKGGCYSGWMYKLKLGKRFKQTWKRRYFTLTDTHLHYYVSPSVRPPHVFMISMCMASVPTHVSSSETLLSPTVASDVCAGSEGEGQYGDYLPHGLIACGQGDQSGGPGVLLQCGGGPVMAGFSERPATELSVCDRYGGRAEDVDLVAEGSKEQGAQDTRGWPGSVNDQ
jgi:hypothetical protein